MSNKKYVLYEEFGNYCITNKENYDAYVRNARLVYKFKQSEYTIREVIDTILGFGGIEENDIIVKVKEN